MPRLRFIQAINRALVEEMARDEKVVLIGEDVEASIFGDTRGLLEQFGPDRVRNTPISEQALTGMAVGAAANGYRIILQMMFANFVYTGFDAIANQMAKLRLMTGGQITLPITVIANYGAGRSTAAQHSDTPFSLLMNLGGIEVVAPSTPENALGLMKSAIRSNNPTFFLEPGGRGGDSGEVPEGEHLTPLGQARHLKAGDDLTLIAMGSMTRMTLQTAKTLEKEGISAQVLDLQSLVPLDETAILAAAKTGRVIIVEESRDRCSAASHIAAVLADRAFYDLKAPVRRITVPDTAMPYAPSAELPLMPNAQRIKSAAQALMNEGR
jgi:pyruvate dehydrogenase E1 component beta subunit